MANAPSTSGPRAGVSNTTAATGQPKTSERCRTPATGPTCAGVWVGGFRGGAGVVGAVVAGTVVGVGVVVVVGTVVVTGGVVVVDSVVSGAVVTGAVVTVEVTGVVVASPAVGRPAGAVVAPTAKSTTPATPAISFRDGTAGIIARAPELV